MTALATDRIALIDVGKKPNETDVACPNAEAMAFSAASMPLS